jgi:hypothetical protein
MSSKRIEKENKRLEGVLRGLKREGKEDRMRE